MLIVETGEKIPNSNTYVSLQEAFDYHSGLGNSDFTNDAPDYATFAAGDTSAQEAALVSATMLLDLMYGPVYIGFPSSVDQSLLWPRIPTVYGTPYTYDYVGYQSYVGMRDAYGMFRGTATIPKELKRAECQAALQILQGDDLLPKQIDANSFVKESKVKIDVIEQLKTYFRTVPTSKLQIINAILYPIVKSGNTLVRG